MLLLVSLGQFALKLHWYCQAPPRAVEGTELSAGSSGETAERVTVSLSRDFGDGQQLYQLSMERPDAGEGTE